jgi:hypothetical protein
MDGLVGNKEEAIMRGDWAELSRLAKSNKTVRQELVEALSILCQIGSSPFDGLRTNGKGGAEMTHHRRATGGLQFKLDRNS